MTSGQIVAINTNNSLFPNQSGSNWNQDIGRGHVVLSNLWGATGATGTVIDNFFDSFIPIIDVPPEALFTQESTRIPFIYFLVNLMISSVDIFAVAIPRSLVNFFVGLFSEVLTI